MDRIEKLKEYLQKTPADSFLQHALALEFIKIGRDDEAGELFTEILAREPNYVGTYYHLARLQERRGQHIEALETYEKGMEAAKAAEDKHAFSELLMARDENEAYEE